MACTTKMKRIIVFLLALILSFTGIAAVCPNASFPVYAKDNVPEENNDDATEPSQSNETAESETELQPVLLDTDKVSTDDILLYSSACVVMDVNTGAILYSKNRSDRHYPASTTKILTTLLALERTKLTDDVTFSRKAVESITWDSSNMELKPGDELTMEQALYGIMLQSANEAAYGVAEYVSGSSENFAKDMTDYAVSLGCRLTHFTNASGLHDDDHYTTAKDLATIARAAAQNKEFRKITGTITYSVENIHYKIKEPETDETESDSENETDTDADEPVPEPFLLYNHHKMVNNEYPYKGCYGGKTGYTGEARNTLVTYVKRGDIDLVCVILDCPGGKNYIYKDTELAMDYCFDNYERLTEEYEAAQALLDYPEMGLRDWYHPEITPLSAEDGLYPYVKQSSQIYKQYLQNRKSQEALDKAISEKSVHAFMEYSRLNNYKPLIIAAIIIFIIAVILSLLLVHLVKVLKRKRSRRRYQKLRQQRLMENASHPPVSDDENDSGMSKGSSDDTDRTVAPAPPKDPDSLTDIRSTETAGHIHTDESENNNSTQADSAAENDSSQIDSSTENGSSQIDSAAENNSSATAPATALDPEEAALQPEQKSDAAVKEIPAAGSSANAAVSENIQDEETVTK